jgi:hypothetical protein
MDYERGREGKRETVPGASTEDMQASDDRSDRSEYVRLRSVQAGAATAEGVCGFMPELKELVILERVSNSITVTSVKEYFGYGNQILLSETAQRELLEYLKKKFGDGK